MWAFPFTAAHKSVRFTVQTRPSSAKGFYFGIPTSFFRLRSPSPSSFAFFTSAKASGWLRECNSRWRLACRWRIRFGRALTASHIASWAFHLLLAVASNPALFSQRVRDVDAQILNRRERPLAESESGAVGYVQQWEVQCQLQNSTDLASGFLNSTSVYCTFLCIWQTF